MSPVPTADDLAVQAYLAALRRFAEPARRALTCSAAVAAHRGRAEVSTSDVLVAMLLAPSPELELLLQHLAIDGGFLVARVRDVKLDAPPRLPLSERVRALILAAPDEADLCGSALVNDTHLLLAIAKERSDEASLLEDLGLELDAARAVVRLGTA